MKVIEVVADSGNADTVAAIAEQQGARDFRLGLKDKAGLQPMRLLAADDKVQSILDALQSVVGAHPSASVYVMPVEIALPKAEEGERKKEDTAMAAREALYDTAEKSALLDVNFLVLIALSTVVAAIGMIEDNVAVVIGAMVIAPLLGPNLAFGLGTALGDTGLMRRSLITLVTGIAFAVALGVAIGAFWPFGRLSSELLARTDVGLDSVALALASGAAAALSLTTGLSSVLVGVMVAVALLPPTATLGLMLGHGRVDLAAGAGLLLAVNIVCVNLACKLVFLLKGIAPRTWWEKQAAQRAMRIYVAGWFVTLMALMLAIYARHSIGG
jgi:uncharacterized hydrophobic protein (TIGR00341 family)